jgi:hypothetical protein
VANSGQPRGSGFEIPVKEWTNVDGESLVGMIIGFDGELVQFANLQGHLVEVPLERLSQESQALAHRNGTLPVEEVPRAQARLVRVARDEVVDVDPRASEPTANAAETVTQVSIVTEVIADRACEVEVHLFAKLFSGAGGEVYLPVQIKPLSLEAEEPKRVEPFVLEGQPSWVCVVFWKGVYLAHVSGQEVSPGAIANMKGAWVRNLTPIELRNLGE